MEFLKNEKRGKMEFLLSKSGTANRSHPLRREREIYQVFICALVCNTVVNFDHGILPASLISIREELNLTDFFLGVLGSIIFLGLTAGSLVAGYLFTNYSCKKLLIFSLTFDIIGASLFALAGNQKQLLISSRIISGFFQVFIIVFFPVWIDHFAGRKRSTLWLTYLQVTVPFGIFLGYSCTGVFNYLNTTYSPDIDVSSKISFLIG